MKRPTVWRCPACEGPLRREAGRLVCAGNHSFDVAREGYVNLLLVQHRRSRAAGDPDDSLEARRAFLEAGHYEPLAAALDRLVAQAVGARPATVLDIGCGEGYYLRGLGQTGADLRRFGIDISRKAARLAARRSPDIDFAVGNAFQLPVQSGSVDAVLQVLSPASVEHVARVLTPGGRYVTVVPGPSHLRALRAQVYDEPRAHEIRELPASVELVHTERVRFDVVLRSAEQVSQLVAMTPYKWHMDPETAARVDAAASLEDEADFVVRVAASSAELSDADGSHRQERP